MTSPNNDFLSRFNDCIPLNVRNLVPYKPGKPIAETKREYNLSRIVKLASNENPFGPSPLALEALKQNLGQAHLYPDPVAYDLKQHLAKHHNLSSDHFVMGNGSDEIIDLLLLTCTQPSDHLLTSDFSFDMYQVRGDATGRKLTKVPMAENFYFSPQNLIEKLSPQTRLLFIANPNNPTGTVLFLKQLEQIAQKALECNCLLVVDEAYFEFGADIDPQNARLNEIAPVGFGSADQLIARFPNVVVMRTFSKLYGLASLRIGYGIMHPQLAELMNRVRLPFNVGIPNQAAAIAALADKAHVAKTVQNNSQQLVVLRKSLSALGFELTPSWANFIWCKAPISGAQLYQKLLEKGVIIRTNGDPRLKDYVRISIGTPEENQILLDTLKTRVLSS